MANNPENFTDKAAKTDSGAEGCADDALENTGVEHLLIYNEKVKEMLNELTVMRMELLNYKLLYVKAAQKLGIPSLKTTEEGQSEN